MNTTDYRLWPKFLVAVCSEGNGDEFCFDTRYPDSSGEYPIVEWDHEIHNENTTEFSRVAENLAESRRWHDGIARLVLARGCAPSGFRALLPEQLHRPERDVDRLPEDAVFEVDAVN